MIEYLTRTPAPAKYSGAAALADIGSCSGKLMPVADSTTDSVFGLVVTTDLFRLPVST